MSAREEAWVVGASMIHGLTEDLIRQIQDALTLSEGTISFRLRSSQLFDRTPYDAIIIPPIRSGESWIQLDRVASTLYLRFTHSSPTTGTRKAMLDLASLRGSLAVRIALVWSPGKIGLNIVDATNPSRGALSTSASPHEFVIDFSDKPEQNENFNQVLDSLGNRMTKLTGLQMTQTDHPFVSHFILAKQHHESNNRRLAFKEGAHAKFALEDMETIARYNRDLFKHFRKKLLRCSADNYFGLRLELRIAATLLIRKVPFNKSEAPDFILGSNVGIECTSAHLDLRDLNNPNDVFYKVKAAMAQKSDYHYKTNSTILAIDVSNLLFHEGQEQCVQILADKDKSTPLIKGMIDDSPFQSVLYFYYAWIPLPSTNDVKLQSSHVRVDRENIDSPSKAFLDSQYPFGDEYILAAVSEKV
jgi:hypothetical protein